MNFASKIVLFLYASVFATLCFATDGHKGAIKNRGEYPMEMQQNQPQQSQVTQGKSTTYGEIRLKHNQHIMAYLPKDVRSYQPLAFRCNDQGQHAGNDISGGCLDYVSGSTHTKWRVRFVQPGTAERVFKLDNKDTPVLRVQFANGDINNVLYEGPNAKQYAQTSENGPNHDGNRDQVVPKGSSIAPSTTPRQAITDCGQYSGLNQIPQRVACDVDAGRKLTSKRG